MAFLDNLFPAALIFILGFLFLLPLLGKKSQAENPKNDDKHDDRDVSN
jgi:hypothetical protein